MTVVKGFWIGRRREKQPGSELGGDADSGLRAERRRARGSERD